MGMLTCQVFDIVRGSTHDGPGMRTTVFLKGCPLRCSWCQNPEGMRGEREIGWDPARCIRCGECIAACPVGALTDSPRGLMRAPLACTRCGACVDTCPARAMADAAREWTLTDLVREVLKDHDYYRTFGGGVTVSGGEPMVWHAFVQAFFAHLHAQGVHTALDTCGLTSETALRAVLAHTDQLLFDLKLLDCAQHEQHTGKPNQRILQNLASVAATIRAAPSGRAPTLWIRTPLIPGVTATPANLAALGAYIHEQLTDVTERWELCAFNNACEAKYEKLGLEWPFAGTPLMGRHQIATLRSAALSAGFPPSRLTISGLIAAADI